MSRETLEWLNTHTRIGDTDRRGTAWHYRQGATNHFPGAVPIDEVRRLILPYEPTEQPIFIKLPDGSYHEVPDFKAIASESDPTKIYSIPTIDYEVHPYKGWLLNNVFNLVGGADSVHISSAGLLQKGAVAWVELSIEETRTIADFPFRPHLLASTSSNGRYRTSYGRKVQATVCDNTLDIAVGEQGQSLSFKHTKGSTVHIKDAQDALGLIVATGDAFEAEVAQLLDWKVPANTFSKYLDLAVPIKAKDGSLLTGAALTRSENVRAKMVQMWRGDERIAPWSGTAFGVLQLANTYYHHERGAKKSTIRVERNMIDSISGATGQNDRSTLALLSKVSESPFALTV